MRALSVITLLLVFSGSGAAQTPTPEFAALATELQRGGHVIVVRHGATVIVVTHKPNILEAFGKDWFEVREGEATIFRPKQDGGTVVLARVLIEEWPAIATAGVKR